MMERVYRVQNGVATCRRISEKRMLSREKEIGRSLGKVDS